MTTLATFEEAILTDKLYPEEELQKESWPLPIEDMVKEFELYLEDIGVRI